MFTIICALGLFCWTTQAPVSEPTTITQRIEISAIEHGIDKTKALKIAKCESNLSQFDDHGNVLLGKENPLDTGIYQINKKYHLDKSKELGFDISTEDGNIAYAHWLMKKEGFSPWAWSESCWNK